MAQKDNPANPHGATCPVCLSIAGLDPSGGAGILADVKTFSALGCYGAAAVTAITAQNTTGVSGVFPVAPGELDAQLAALLSDFPLVYVKIGMVPTSAHTEVIARRLRQHARRVAAVVCDPVMVASSGTGLADGAAVTAMRELLFPLCTLVTPNLPEASRLWEIPLDAFRTDADVSCLVAAACRFAGGESYLVKGGHLPGSTDTVTDVLLTPSGIRRFASPRVDTANTHGTGCTLSSAITACLAQGHSLDEAVRKGKDYLTAALEAGRDLHVGAGHGPVNHFFSPRPLAVRGGQAE